MFICGGYNGELILSDLWKINLQTFQWTRLPAVMPEPAYFHCAAVTPVSKTSLKIKLTEVDEFVHLQGFPYFYLNLCRVTKFHFVF